MLFFFSWISIKLWVCLCMHTSSLYVLPVSIRGWDSCPRCSVSSSWLAAGCWSSRLLETQTYTDRSVKRNWLVTVKRTWSHYKYHALTWQLRLYDSAPANRCNTCWNTMQWTGTMFKRTVSSWCRWKHSFCGKLLIKDQGVITKFIVKYKHLNL